MTREEAIKIIDCYDIGFHDLSGEKIPADKLADAFDMAIEALKRKPILCSHCKHYILHDHRCGWWNHGVSNVDWCSYGERKEP